MHLQSKVLGKKIADVPRCYPWENDSACNHISCLGQHFQYNSNQFTKSWGFDSHRGMGHCLYHLCFWSIKWIYSPVAENQTWKMLSKAYAKETEVCSFFKGIVLWWQYKGIFYLEWGVSLWFCKIQHANQGLQVRLKHFLNWEENKYKIYVDLLFQVMSWCWSRGLGRRRKSYNTNPFLWDLNLPWIVIKMQGI